MTGRKTPPTGDRPTVSTMIYCKDAPTVVSFLEEVFGAETPKRPLYRGNGSLWNAEVVIGDSMIMISEAEQGGPAMPAFCYVYVEDADATYEKAIDAGAAPMMPVEDQFYGDRAGGVQDSQGNIWWIAAHQRDMDADEIDEAARAFEAAKSGAGA